MKVLSDSDGFSIVFENEDEFEQHLNNLRGFLEAVKEQNMSSPHVYSVFNESMSKEEMQEKISKVRNNFREG